MTLTTVLFHDDVVEAIDRYIAAHAPERGGALLGPVGEPVVSLFLPDQEAIATSVTYTPSQRLREKVREVESARPELELKGIIHSHPGGFDRPSAGDHDAYADSLQNSPWLGRFVCPIVTHSGRGASAPHEIPLSGARMSVFIAEARTGDRPEVVRASTRVIPIMADSRRIADLVVGRASGSTGHTDLDGATYATVSISAAAADYTLLFPRNYPTFPPLVLRTVAGDTVTVPVTWDPTADADQRFAAVAAALAPAAPEPVRPDSTGRDGITERLSGIVSQRVRDARVLVVGVGSGGSLTVEALARAGVEHFALVDPDLVEPANLSRSVYTVADIGLPKVEALARRVAAINPLAIVETLASATADLGRDQLRDAVVGSDIVIAATDDPDAQALLNREAWSAGRPAVFAGVYARGRAGEVLFTVPGASRCYRCAAANRGASLRTGVKRDYGTGQLHAEPALGADIAHLVTISTKIAIGLIELGEDAATEVDAAALVMQAIVDRTTFVIASMTPRFDYFPRVFAATASQLAYQTLWLEVLGDPDCPVCGTHPAEPTVEHRPVDVAGIRGQVGLPPVAVISPEPVTPPLTEVIDEPKSAPLSDPVPLPAPRAKVAHGTSRASGVGRIIGFVIGPFRGRRG